MNNLVVSNTFLANNFESYLKGVFECPVLSETEEYELACKLFDHDDKEAAHKLVFSHLKFVVKIASKYINTGLMLSDLVQEGTVGLMKAVKNFNPYHGVRLASFAIHWIKSEIHEFILKNWSLVKIATTKAQRKVFFNINKFKKKQKFFSCDEIKEIADFLNVSEKDVSNMAQRMSHKGDMYSDELESADIVLEDTTSNHAVLLEQQNLLDFKKTSISNAVAKLDPRSQTIIKERWLNEDNKSSLKDLANKFNISLVRIGQIEKQALKALKESLSSRD